MQAFQLRQLFRMVNEAYARLRRPHLGWRADAMTGRVTRNRPGHDLNNTHVATIMQKPQAWERVTLEPIGDTGAQSAQP